MSQGVRESGSSVAREAVGADESFEVLNCRRAEFDSSHGSEFFERDCLARSGFLESPLRSFEGARDPVQDLDY